MPRTLIKTILVIAALYAVLHLILGSTPVQRRVLDEVRHALNAYGIDLQIESIEFSPFSPKIYLNRVTLLSKPNSQFGLPEIMPIDKIKVEFRPLALISKQIIIDEALIFHPRLQLPHADKTYTQISSMIQKSLKLSRGESGYSVSFKKFGVVDAMFDVTAPSWGAGARSRSLTFTVESEGGSQHTISVESSNLHVEKDKMKADLSHIDLEFDISPKSLRVNRALFEAEGLSANLRGTSSLPISTNRRPDLLQVFYELKVPLPFVTSILGKNADLPMSGSVNLNGTANISPQTYAAKGTASFKKVIIDDIHAGSGDFNYQVANEKLSVRDLKAAYSDGTVRSDLVELALKDRFDLSGDLIIHNMTLQGLLDSLHSPVNPVRMDINGRAKLSGTLKPDLNIKLGVKADFKDFYAMKGDHLPLEAKNVVLKIPTGAADGVLSFSEEKMDFDTKLTTLQGSARATGFVGFNSTAKIHVDGEKLSLSVIDKIGELKMGGVSDVTADIDVKGRDATVTGKFDAQNAEIAGLVIGPVKGNAYFQNEMLSFDRLETAGIEPVTGNGFLDFRPEEIHYKFNVDIKRAFTDTLFNIFKKKSHEFVLPRGGEISTRLLIEGGEDKKSVEVIASGQAKDFSIGPEQWRSGLFSVTYRPDWLELNRVLLLKKFGSLEVRGIVAGKDSKVSLQTGGFRIEELDTVGRSSLGGELVGEVLIEGDLSQFPERGSGELKLTKTSFRGVNLADSYLRAATRAGLMEVDAKLFGDKMRAVLEKPVDSPHPSYRRLRLTLDGFDFMPVLAPLMRKDLSTINEVVASGEMTLAGNFSDWSSVNGTGSIGSVTVGLKGTPMKNSEPLGFDVEAGAFRIKRFRLVGSDSQLFVDSVFQPGTKLEASIDGKMDLQFLQPFIPGLEYGTGKVSAGVRFFGKPSAFDMLGNISVQDGLIRVSGLRDEVRSVNATLSLSQDRINVDKAEGILNGGRVEVTGSIATDRFDAFRPNLKVVSSRAQLNPRDYLSMLVTSQLSITGADTPYLISGTCQLHEARLKQLSASPSEDVTPKPPTFKFDIDCEANNRIYVDTDTMKAEFKGNLHLLGTDQQIGLLGSVDSLSGSLIFRETKFELTSGTARFESAERVYPRFNVSGHAIIKAKDSSQSSSFSLEQDYDVGIQALGTPDDYKIRLSSTPSLSEPEIVSLMVIGVPRIQRDQMSQADTSVILGTALANELKIQSKIQSALGLDIKLNAQAANSGAVATNNTSPNFVPSVQLQYGITKKTKLYYSNSLSALNSVEDTREPLREFKIEQILDENLTVNGTAVNRSRGSSTQTTPSYGIDVRYRFSFE